MSGSTEKMRQKIERTRSLGSVVHTMKALAAASIGQFEESVRSLDDYYRTLVLGLSVCLRASPAPAFSPPAAEGGGVALLLGSSQGLVGQFNDQLANFAAHRLAGQPGTKKIWVVGERLFYPLAMLKLQPEKIYSVPTSVQGITPLIARLLSDNPPERLLLYHNRPSAGALYESTERRLLPLDEDWFRNMSTQAWPSKNLPEVLGPLEDTLRVLIGEYLFVSLFKACAESLAAENSSRLAAMQRAERNIDETLLDLQRTYHRMRQQAIDEELFDIIAGFESLKKQQP